MNDKVLAFTGDYKPEYMKRVVALLGKNRKLSSGSFDMEPLEVLRDMLRDSSFDLIGGAPQVVKVYKYSNTKAYGVFWPNKLAETVTLFGRPLLEYEKLDCLIVDPDTMQTVD